MQVSNPIPQGSQILIIERQLPNVLIKFDGIPQPFLCLHHAPRDARVAGKVESDYGNLGMYRLRSQQSGFRFLYTLGPPD